MLSRFEKENELDHILSKMKGEHLAQVYLRVFNTNDGLLVLRDMENRSFINNAVKSGTDEGVRQAYLSILSRMKEAVTKTGGK